MFNQNTKIIPVATITAILISITQFAPHAVANPTLFDSNDLKCFRAVMKQQKISIGMAWGFDGPIVTPAENIVTAIPHGSQKSSDPKIKKLIPILEEQNGAAFGVITDSGFSTLQIIPYLDWNFSHTCPLSVRTDPINLIEIDGVKYYAQQDDITDMYAIYNGDTKQLITPNSDATTMDECVYKETQRQNLLYYGAKDLLTANGTTVIPMTVLDQNTTLIETVPMSDEQREGAIGRLAFLFNREAGDFFRSYNALVAKQKRDTPDLTTAPSSDDALASLNSPACQNSNYFKASIDAIKTNIKDCTDNFAQKSNDCRQ